MGLHVGIIMDGNRRFGKDRVTDGHRAGAHALKSLLESLDYDDYGISTLTLYAFSMENFKRSDDEKAMLFSLFREFMEEIEKVTRKKDVAVRFVGRLSLFPQDMHDAMLKTMDRNPPDAKYQVNFLMAYDGRDELVDAMRRIARRGMHPDDIDRSAIRENLYLGACKPVDLIIRTGMTDGMRLSGFMLYDSSYAEFVFLEKYWPDFTIDDLKAAIERYTNRTRRFGR